MMEDYTTDYNATEEVYSPISKEGIQLVSTPIASVMPETNLQQPAVTTLGIGDPSTPSKNGEQAAPITPIRQQKTPMPASILKKTPSASQLRKDNGSDRLEDSFIDRHPELGYAKRNGDELNPVKCARVIFSPTKEVVSYSKGYYDEDKCEDDEIRTKHDVILEPMDFNDASSSNGGDSFINRLFTDTTIPYMLSMYLQIILNIIIVMIIFYFGYIFYSTTTKDINNRLEMYINEAKQEISLCSRHYYRNKCSVELGQKRLPALEQSCFMWEKCMNRDPQLIGKSKISAETFADIVNGFVKPVSWKALIFINCLIFGSLLVSNISLSSYRNKIDSSTNKILKKRIQNLENVLENFERQSQNLALQPSSLHATGHTQSLTYTSSVINRKSR